LRNERPITVTAHRGGIIKLRKHRGGHPRGHLGGRYAEIDALQRWSVVVT
jgi:hypothetical protein